jgi:hypothetical protein
MEDGDEIVASDAAQASDGNAGSGMNTPVPAYYFVRRNAPGRDQLSSTAGEAARSRVLAQAANSFFAAANLQLSKMPLKTLVEPGGIEPPTSSMPLKRSPN